MTHSGDLLMIAVHFAVVKERDNKPAVGSGVCYCGFLNFGSEIIF